MKVKNFRVLSLLFIITALVFLLKACSSPASALEPSLKGTDNVGVGSLLNDPVGLTLPGYDT